MPRRSCALPEDCILHILECGVLDREDWKTMRSCCKHVRSIVDRVFFRSATVTRTALSSPSISNFVQAVHTFKDAVSVSLTRLVIYGASTLGVLTVTTEELWLVLDTACALRSVVLDSVYVSGPPAMAAHVLARPKIDRFAFVWVDFESARIFTHALTAVGMVEWLHMEHITFTRGIHPGRNGLGMDDVICKTWEPYTRRISFLDMPWPAIGHFTSSFVPSDPRASSIEHIDISLVHWTRAHKVFPLVPACRNLHDLRIHIHPAGLKTSTPLHFVL